jgi:hypothetical protein
MVVFMGTNETGKGDVVFSDRIIKRGRRKKNRKLTEVGLSPAFQRIGFKNFLDGNQDIGR